MRVHSLLRVLALVVIPLSTEAYAAEASQTPPVPQTTPQTQVEKEVIALSRQKWLWMAERNTEALGKMFDEQAVFVHMGATMTKAEELGVIESGRIQYKQADVQEISIRTIGDTAIVLSKIQLVAIVGGNEVTNPFMVTETYIRQAGGWKLGALSFTRRTNPN